eukprot:CAMPEP_0203777100 /NCGR_PEP_ID=MMETSP0099_2-20121227/7179_1 /ASSEMBLY_ACC=CAM_ASM_000209 /TAXON_ID=96639 /ORGANISM=" , Strain NY0313808BC1" /LENGTH=44 /DNA_ID= /DNA_START= /DNA_END= /DNA_ORIENTATION=
MTFGANTHNRTEKSFMNTAPIFNSVTASGLLWDATITGTENMKN